MEFSRRPKDTSVPFVFRAVANATAAALPTSLRANASDVRDELNDRARASAWPPSAPISLLSKLDIG